MRTSRGSRWYGPLCLALALLPQACLFDPTGSADRCDITAAGIWILVAPGSPLGPRITLLRVDSDGTAPVRELLSRSADGSLGRTFNPELMDVRRSCDSLAFQGVPQGRTDTVDVVIRWDGDTARGALQRDTTAWQLFGVRVDSSLLVPPESDTASGLPHPPPDSTPRLLLRVDDSWAEDPGFLARLWARGLPAELPTPTRLVGEPTHDGWPDVLVAAYEGYSVVAHSRHHAATTGPGLPFLAEVIGSVGDLRDHGLSTRTFVQPGTWTDSLMFDSASKLATWRGALLRNVVTVFEAYESGWKVPTGRLGVLPFGVEPTEITGYDSASIVARYHKMFTPGTYTIFVFHSRKVIPPDALDWFLDSVAAAAAGGRLRLVASAADLLGPF